MVSYNDKTTVLYDGFIYDITSGTIFNDHTFELLERRGGKSSLLSIVVS